MRALLLAAFLMSGCAYDPFDPYQVPGTWRPLGSNEQNLRAMLVRPTDLDGGVNDPGADGQRAAAAVERLRADRVKRLPDSGVSQVVPVATGGAAGAP